MRSRSTSWSSGSQRKTWTTVQGQSPGPSNETWDACKARHETELDAQLKLFPEDE